VLVLPEGASPPVVFDASRQKAVYKIWLEHVLAENEPIEVTRRYEAAFAAYTSPHRPVTVPGVKNSRIDSDSEDDASADSSSSSSTSISVHVVSPKGKKFSRPLKKASSDTGIVKVSTKSAPSASMSKKTSSNTEFSPSGDGKRNVRGGRRSDDHSDEEPEFHPSTSRVSKMAAKKSSESSKAKPKRGRHVESDEEDEFAALSSPPKVSKRGKAVSPHVARSMEVWDVDEGPVKAKPSKKVPAAAASTSSPSTKPVSKRSSSASLSSSKPHELEVSSEVMVYLAQAKEAEKADYRARVPTRLFSFVSDVSKATHIVLCKDDATADDPVSFSVLYAIAFAKWVVRRDWLEDAILTRSVPKPDAYEFSEYPGCRMSRLLHEERARYLEEHGILPQNADDTNDPDMPTLLFSDLTFNIDRLKTVFNRNVMKQLHDMILFNGGLVSGEEKSDIWITRDTYTTVYGLQYGNLGAPPDEDLRLRQLYPDWHKRHFTNPNTLADMPVYAIPFDFIRDTLVNGVTANPKHYRNLLHQLVGL